LRVRGGGAEVRAVGGAVIISLRACYGSSRLSEDLDFTGGAEFKRDDLTELADILTTRLQTRYGLPVRVSEPVKADGKVSTWKLTIETRPGQKHLPAQRIHLDICAIPSHDPRPMMLRNLVQLVDEQTTRATATLE
jgi:Nucleotidyl transferase AbiEii toxin, Type IV TA system